MEADVVEVVGGIIRRGGRFLLGRRPAGKAQAGCWEFVGGKVEPGETPEQALVRECREEIALPVVHVRRRTAVTHAYPDKTVHLTLLDCEPAEGAEATALEHDALGWFTPEEALRLSFCPADRAVLPSIFEPLAARVVKAFAARGLTCATAESCTGGGVGCALTSVPGASAVFRGGVISYANAVKRAVLGVSGAVLDSAGPVSAACAEQMARGARDLLKVDVAVSVTGLAGPGGDGVHPAGCVWFGCAAPSGVTSDRRQFPGDRAAVRAAAVEHALGLLLAAAEGRAGALTGEGS